MKNIDGLVAKYAEEAAENKIPYSEDATPEQKILADEERKELAGVLGEMAVGSILGINGEIWDGIEMKIDNLTNAINFAKQKGLKIDGRLQLKPKENECTDGPIVGRGVALIESRLCSIDDDGYSVAKSLGEYERPPLLREIAYSILGKLFNDLDVERIVNRDIDEAYRQMVVLKSFGLRIGSPLSDSSMDLGQ